MADANLPNKLPGQAWEEVLRPRDEHLVGAVGWRFLKHYPEGESRWEPKGFEIIFPTHVWETTLEGLVVRDSTLYPC